MKYESSSRFRCLAVRLLFVLLLIPFTALGQTDTIRITGGTIEEAFREIERQTDYTIAFIYEDLDKDRVLENNPKEVSLPEALAMILKGTGCNYRIEGRHIVIFSEKKGKGKALPEERKGVIETLISPVEYKGRVVDAKEHLPLSYATISMLDDEERVLISAVSDDEGSFRILFPSEARRIRVSFVGFITQYRELGDRATMPEDFFMEQDETLLDEVRVTGSVVQYLTDRNSYVVTDKMREGVSNAQELVNKIHGVRFDKISNLIKVGNETNVLLLVDGMQQSEQYIKNLSPERIGRVEVVNQPSGRFMSDGYAAIINFILVKDYSGYDINIRNFSIANPAGSNGDDWLMNTQPGFGFTYTRNKLNLYGNAVYGRSRWNTPLRKSLWYADPDRMDLESENVSTDNPNDRYKYNGNYIGGGVNYEITPDHLIALQVDYTYEDIRTDNRLRMRNSALPDEGVYSVVKETFNRTKDHDYVGTLFYKGKIGRLSLYADFSYNNYSNRVENIFTQKDAISLSADNNYDEGKDQTIFNAEGTYLFSDKASLNAGYSNVWRKYDSFSESYITDEAGERRENLLDYHEARHKFYSYLSVVPFEKLSVKAGVAVENSSVDNNTTNRSYWNIQPYLQLNYKANKHVNIHTSYTTATYYPSLFQLSRLSTITDSAMVQVGNPDLKSALQHTVSTRFTFWDRLSFVGTFKYTPKNISEVHQYDSYMYMRTFENLNMKEYTLQAVYDQSIGPYVTWNSLFTYYYGRIKQGDISNSASGWMLDSEINYFNPRHNLGMQLGYYRGMRKQVLLQGYQMMEMDTWMLSISKQFWNKRLSVNLSYIPPISWGVRYDQERDINTPSYKENLNLNLKTYTNMILLRVSLRFNSGKVKRTDRGSVIERETRETRTIGF